MPFLYIMCVRCFWFCIFPKDVPGTAKRKLPRHKSCDMSILKPPPNTEQTWLDRYAPTKEASCNFCRY